MTPSPTDQIEKHVFLRASVPRVWRALSDAREFGAWFGMSFDGPFEAHEQIRGRLTNPPYEHVTLALEVVAIEAERYFAYRWHPAAIDTAVDYAAEPMTLVEFELAAADGGCQLTIRESGFDALPEARRATALRMNTGGWNVQAERIERHVTRA